MGTLPKHRRGGKADIKHEKTARDPEQILIPEGKKKTLPVWRKKSAEKKEGE